MALSQAEVAVGRSAVAGLLERTEELDADGVAVFARLEEPQQFDHLFALGEVADLKAVHRELVAQGLQLLGVGFVVDAADVRNLRLVEGLRDRLVGQEHELFDELVRFVVLDHHGAVGPAVLIAVDFDFLHVQVERPDTEAFGPQDFADGPEVRNHRADEVQLGVGEFGQRTPGRARLVGRRGRQGADGLVGVAAQESVGLLIGQAFAARDHRVRKLSLHELGVRREFADDRLD